MKKCKDKECRKEFEPIRPIQPYCFDCTVKRSKMQVKKRNERKEREQKKELKEKLKTVSDYRKDARYWFQRWIRIRDLGKNCISCETLLTDIRTFDAGHYYNAYSYPQLLFNEFNCNGQCKNRCNNMLSGNLIEYRKGLIKRWGMDVLLDLDELADDKTKRVITKQEYIEIADKYKKLVKDVKI